MRAILAQRPSRDRRARHSFVFVVMALVEFLFRDILLNGSYRVYQALYLSSRLLVDEEIDVNSAG